MVFFVNVEADHGEVLGVRLPDGTTAGKAILGFVTGLEAYCGQFSNVDLSWFAKLESCVKEPLCSLTEQIRKSYYASERFWDFREDEFAAFEYRFPKTFSEDQSKEKEIFLSIVRRAEESWTDTETLLSSVRKLIELLNTAHLEADEPWYDPVDTHTEFEALQQTLALFRSRDAQVVRLRFY